MKLKPLDIVTLKGRVEIAQPNGAQIVFLAPNGHEVRAQVAHSEITSVEPGPISAGDEVFIAKGKKQIGGDVIHRVGDAVWVTWEDGSHSVETVEALKRP